MHTDQVMTEFITDPLQFYQRINGQTEMHDLCLLNDDLVVLGDFLGDLTNEITSKHGQGAYITQFLCGGFKIMPIKLVMERPIVK